jgi:predicted nucleic acid-binding protein
MISCGRLGVHRLVALLAVGERELGPELAVLVAQAPVLGEQRFDALAQRRLARPLAGARRGRRRPVVAQALDLGAELGSSWLRAGALAGDLRWRGATVPLTDIVIAVAATGAGAALWSADADFERLTGVMDDLTLRYQRPG